MKSDYIILRCLIPNMELGSLAIKAGCYLRVQK